MFNLGVCFAVLNPQNNVLFIVCFAISLFCSFMTGYMAATKKHKEDEKSRALEEEIKNLKNELANFKSQNK